MKTKEILVLGAYGLAGRTVIAGLKSSTDDSIVAAGRDPERLKEVISGSRSDRCRLLELDAGDLTALRRACETADLVINTIGPYALLGSSIARVAIECGVSYIDCANEQIHYWKLSELDPLARDRGLLMVTGAGAIPGFSTLLAAALLDRFPSATSVDIAFAQFRHAYPGAGLASIMSGVLDAVHRPYALVDGDQKPVLLGKSLREFSLQAPFKKKKMLEVPTIDTITLAQRYPLKNIRTWFYLGEQPAWLFGLIRLLQPQKRKWAYDLIRTVANITDSREYKRSVNAGHGPEALLYVEAGNGHEKRFGSVLLKDGAAPMGCLPAIIAGDFLAGRIRQTGLTTPLDLVSFDRMVESATDAIIAIDMPSILH